MLATSCPAVDSSRWIPPIPREKAEILKGNSVVNCYCDNLSQCELPMSEVTGHLSVGYQMKRSTSPENGLLLGIRSVPTDSYIDVGRPVS
jgi:hypothetical protein